MTGAELARIRCEWDLSANQMAILVGAAAGRTIRRWEAGAQIPTAVIRLLDIIRLHMTAEQRGDLLNYYLGHGQS